MEMVSGRCGTTFSSSVGCDQPCLLAVSSGGLSVCNSSIFSRGIISGTRYGSGCITSNAGVAKTVSVAPHNLDENRGRAFNCGMFPIRKHYVNVISKTWAALETLSCGDENV